MGRRTRTMPEDYTHMSHQLFGVALTSYRREILYYCKMRSCAMRCKRLFTRRQSESGTRFALVGQMLGVVRDEVPVGDMRSRDSPVTLMVGAVVVHAVAVVVTILVTVSGLEQSNCRHRSTNKRPTSRDMSLACSTISQRTTLISDRESVVTQQ